MEHDAVRLYEMIWRQFVACQMPPAEYTSTTVIAQAGDFEARIRGRILRFDGYTRVLPACARKDEDRTLPDFVVGETLDVEAIEPVQHFTKPPPRYSEASLVRELEKRSIGRPSTYAAIISTIQERGYVTLSAAASTPRRSASWSPTGWSRTSTTCSTSASRRSSRASSTRSPTARRTGAKCSIPFMATFPES